MTRTTLIRGVLAGCIVLGLLATAPARSQADPQRAESVADAQQPIALTDLPRAAERLDALLRRAQVALDRSPQWKGVEDSINELDELLREADTRLETVDGEALSLRDLDDLVAWWQRQSSRLDRVAGRIDSRWQVLIDLRTELETVRMRWALTGEEAAKIEDPDRPGSITARIDGSVAAIQAVQRELQLRLEPIFDLLEKVAELEALTDTNLRQLDAWAAKARHSLLRRDRPGLWSAAAWTSETAVSRLTWRWEHLVEYLGTEQGTVAGQLVTFVAIAVFLIWLRRWRGDLGDGSPPLLPVGVLLDRPLSAALVTTVVIGQFRHLRSPWWWDELALLVVVVPLLRMLPPIIPPASRRLLRVSLVAIAALSFATLLTAGPSKRLALIVLATGFVVSVGWLRAQQPPAVHWVSRTARLGLDVSIGVLGFAILALVIGWTHLGKFLIPATIAAIVVTLSLAATGLVVDTLIQSALRSAWAGRLASVEAHRDHLARSSRYVVLTIAAFLALSESLREFLLFDPIGDWFAGVLAATVAFGDFEISLSRIGTLVLVLGATVLLARVLKVVLLSDILPRLGVSRSAAYAYAILCYYVTISLGIIAAAGAAGLGSTQLTVLAGALGVGIGFGLQTIVNNFVSGLILIFERPVKLGDMIEVGTLTGEVTKIGIRASTVRTLEGAEVVVPNGALLADQVVNWTLSDRKRRLTVRVGVTYGTDPEEVLEILKRVSDRHPRIIAAPAPTPLFVGFGESSLDFELRFWTFTFEEQWAVLSQVAVEVNRELKSAGIEIPFPQRTLHLQSVDASAAGTLRGSEPELATDRDSELSKPGSTGPIDGS